MVHMIRSLNLKKARQSGDGSSQISVTIKAPENNYADHATYALVNGEPHIFGGTYDGFKILFF